MKRLLIVWHSRTGAAQAMAEAAARGAAGEPEIEVALIAAENLTAADILAADGYIFAAYLVDHAVIGPIKRLLHRA